MKQQAEGLPQVRSDDFLGVARFPAVIFIITSVKPLAGDAAGNNAVITGNLTLKGKANSLTCPAKIRVRDGVAPASGKATIDRTKHDGKYGPTLFGTT